MDTNQNKNPLYTEVKRFTGRVPAGTFLLFAAAAAVCAAILPEFGMISFVVISAAVIFCASAKANLLFFLIPLAGVGAAYFRSGIYFAALCGVLVVASFISGQTLRRHGFFRALIMYTLVVYGAAVAGVAVYMKLHGITPADLSQSLRIYIDGILQMSINSYSNSIPAESLESIMLMYDDALDALVMYSPVILAWVIELCGIACIRIVGVCHNFTGSIHYPLYKRFAYGDKVFAYLFIASALVGTFGSGVVGACAENTMMVLLVPGVCAGIAVNRRAVTERRSKGVRGLPISLWIIIGCVVMSPIIGLMVLGITGAVDAIKRKTPPKK